MSWQQNRPNYGPPPTFQGRPPPQHQQPWIHPRPPPVPLPGVVRRSLPLLRHPFPLAHMNCPRSLRLKQPAPVWTEHTNAEGRKYYFNTVTRQSSWEKPDELMTPEEVCSFEN